jgi:hypothetical protein
MHGSYLFPFGLSLSKPCSRTTTPVRPEPVEGPEHPELVEGPGPSPSSGQGPLHGSKGLRRRNEGFDKLSPNGVLEHTP